MKENNFIAVFCKLKSILKDYEKELIVKADSPDNYYLNTGTHPVKPKEEGFFGMVQIKKNYVSFHLFPVYVYPELLHDISVELRKKMQGKSCFNFKKPEEKLLEELSKLTRAGFNKFKEKNLL